VDTGSHQGKSAARYNDLRATPRPTSPAEIKAFRDAEVRLLPIVKAAGIKPDERIALPRPPHPAPRHPVLA